jgi:hypothetical protein
VSLKMCGGLPPFLGGKRRLVPLMFSLLSTAARRVEWRGLRFIDPFLGGGSVSLLAKTYGFEVHCNDVAYRSALVGHALIANSDVTLTDADAALLFREPDGDYQRTAEERFSPSVFSTEHARFLDRGLHWARSGPFPGAKRHLMELLLVRWALRCQPMSQLRGTDARAAAEGDFDRVSPRRVGHYVGSLRLLQPRAVTAMARQLNGAVFPGRGFVSQIDAVDFLGRTEGDVVYFDPPYPGTTAYEKEYRALDILLEGRELAPSRFSSEAGVLGELFQTASHIPAWLVSLNNTVLTLDELLDMIRCYRQEVRSVEVPYSHLGSIASERKNAENREYIVLATA